MKWLNLTSYSEAYLARGNLLKFKADYPFENQVIMMVCESPINPSLLGLMTISGSKAGINMFVVFPQEAIGENGLYKEWIIANWGKWISPNSEVDDALIYPRLEFNDL